MLAIPDVHFKMVKSSSTELEMLVFNLVADKGFVQALDDGALNLETATVYKPVGSLIRVESFHAFDAHMLG